MITTVVVAILAAGGYVLVRRLAPVIVPALTGSGCQASASRQTVLLDTQQASIAATIAGVAHRQSMPPTAVTVAYATAMQESKLHNLNYGDMDSVGVFQQRPSEGWGPRNKLEDPVYATTKFFRALKAVPGYQRLPIYQAAQDVQHSADGSAYIQYEKMAAEMSAAFTGQHGHAVYCWWSSAVPKRADRGAITRSLAGTFGAAASSATTTRHDLVLRVARPKLGWEVAAWLVTHASSYGIHQVSFGGYYWRAATGAKGWVRDPGPPTTNAIKLS
ncbi:MAG: hypothetical protein ACHP9Z_29515 [Streptosporangiales bacterium]